MIRCDLEAAGIPYSIMGPDGPEFADFHSLRHTYLTLLGRSGVDLKTAQELAGHSTPTLTARYSHRRLSDLTQAVAKLPNLTPPTLESSTTTAEHQVSNRVSSLENNDLEAVRDVLKDVLTPRIVPPQAASIDIFSSADAVANPSCNLLSVQEEASRSADLHLSAEVKALGFEPRTYGLKVRCSTG